MAKPTLDDHELAERILRACDAASLYLGRKSSTPANAGRSCALALAIAMRKVEVVTLITQRTLAGFRRRDLIAACDLMPQHVRPKSFRHLLKDDLLDEVLRTARQLPSFAEEVREMAGRLASPHPR